MALATIIPNQDFTHEGVRFLKGESYDVSSEDAEYFTRAGWVGETSVRQDQTLDIHDLELGHLINVY